MGIQTALVRLDPHVCIVLVDPESPARPGTLIIKPEIIGSFINDHILAQTHSGMQKFGQPDQHFSYWIKLSPKSHKVKCEIQFSLFS